MFRCLTIVALVLAVPGQSAATVNVWLSGTGTTSSGSAFPATAGAVSILEPYLGGSGTVYIWGRPDAGKSLENLSLNLVAETQSICSPDCSTPDAIEFTSATMFNPTFGAFPVTRFEYVDDSTVSPPLSIEANYIEGLEGLTIFNSGSVPAVGIGNSTDPLKDSLNNSWLIAEVEYDVLATGENTETRLFLEIGPLGMNHTGEGTDAHSVKFGDATDMAFTDVVMFVGGEYVHVNRGVHFGNFDALIRPRILPGDADRNGVVAPADYDIWRANFGSTTQLAADHNLNATVDAADYIIWRNNLGLSAGSGSGAVLVIPEPSAAILMCVATMALWAFCRPSVTRAK